MANTINISPVISPDILKTISTATAIKSFGAQLKNQKKETVIIGDQTKKADIQVEINKLTKESEQLGKEESVAKENALYAFNSNQITQEEYNSITKSVEISIKAEKEVIDLQIAKLKQDQQNIDNNPNNKIKNAQKGFKTRIKNLKKQTQNAGTKSKRDLTKQIISNVAKTLAPVVALQLTNQFTNIIFQRKRLEDLVDQVNNYIDTQVKDTQTVTIATNLRNNAITLIDNSIKKLQNLENTLKTITAIVVTITLVVAIITGILSLPFPFLLPVKVQLQPKLQKILILIAALSAILAIATMLLGNEITRLNELKDRLKEISLKLDGKTLTDLNEQEFTDLTTSLLNGGGQFPMYKGFKFAIKEEQNQAFVVKGNKRHYAVAIDRYGVEIIKSDYSFTQDPNDLIEQLKLIIDQQNLQG
jgi:hypothetical protein